MTLEELAKKYSVELTFLEAQLKVGIEIEKEHLTDGDDIELAKKIAMDHLHEIPDYYDKLAKIEKKNAKQLPSVYYCKHIEKGVTQYEDEMILIDDDALNQLNPTMAGKPVYVMHVNEVDVKNIQEEADGYVFESFYLECDGWHWAKFICVSDKSHEAVAKGWSVSNAYTPSEWAGGGEHHSVPFNRKIINGIYTHLAIVPDPRYEGAKIYTPEQFKQYKEEKELELKELQNSKKEKGTMLKFMRKKRETQEVDGDLVLELKNGKEVSINEMIEVVSNAKKNEDDDDKDVKVNMDEIIPVGDEKMTIKDLVNAYLKTSKKNQEDEDAKEKEKQDKKNEEEEEEKKNAEEEAKKKEEENKKNMEEDDAKKKDEDEKKNGRTGGHYQALMNARSSGDNEERVVIESGADRVARGKERY